MTWGGDLMADLFPSVTWHVDWPLVKGCGWQAEAKEPDMSPDKKRGITTTKREEPQDNSKLSTCGIAIMLVRLHCSIKTTTWESYHRRSTGLQTLKDARQAWQRCQTKGKSGRTYSLKTDHSLESKSEDSKYCTWKVSRSGTNTVTGSPQHTALNETRRKLGPFGTRQGQWLHRAMSSTFVSSSFPGLHARFPAPSRKNREGGMRVFFVLLFTFLNPWS